MGDYRALDVACYIVNRAINKCKPVGPSQLYRILYYSYLEYFRRTNEKLFYDDIEARDHTAVPREVYRKFCIWGENRLALIEDTDIHNLIIDDYIDELIDMSAWDLACKFDDNKNSAWIKVKESLGDKESNIIPFELLKKEAKTEYHLRLKEKR